MTTQLRSPLKWVGGKHHSADRIVALFPAPSTYDTFVDVCGGAGHITICKPSYGHNEIYNDADNNLVTFWQEVQIHGQELQESLDQHIFSRKIYYEYYHSLFDGTDLLPFERAMRWFYVLRGTGTGWLRKSPVGWVGGQLKTGVQSYRSAVELFQQIQERFKYITIDNRDVLATIKRYDSSRTLLYIDPPYFGAEGYYEPSKNGFPHEEMAQLLQQVQGHVALSYYPHPVIDAYYPPEKWHRATWQQSKASQIQIERREEDIATEQLLTNYVSPSVSLWDECEVSA